MRGKSREPIQSGENKANPDFVDADVDNGQTDVSGRRDTQKKPVDADRTTTGQPETLELLATGSYYSLDFYEDTLDPNGTPKEKVEIPKEMLPALPNRFERTRLAKMPDGSLGSYRDMEASVQSSHIHEYPDHWELHVDCFNPHYRPIEHAMVDTGVSGQAWDTVTALLVGTLATLTVTRDLTLESSQLGDLEIGSMAMTLVESALAGLSVGTDLLGLV